MVARLRSLAVKLRSACNCANEVRRQRSVNRGAGSLRLVRRP